MPEITLESLATRVAALEKELAELKAYPPRTKDWRRTIGTMEDTEFARAVEAEIQAQCEADRAAAREGVEE